MQAQTDNRIGRVPSNFTDLSGRIFNRLTVIQPVRGPALLKWLCQCLCGAEVLVPTSKLKSNHTRSCGCLKTEEFRTRITTHGKSNSPEYRSFSHAKDRCQRPTDKCFEMYGGRGIEFRFTSFDEFFADIGLRPNDGFSVERKDNNGHYEPGNVRWATATDQARNRRSNRWLTFGGQTKTIAEWAEFCGMGQTKLLKRVMYGFCDGCLFLPGRRFCKHKGLR